MDDLHLDPKPVLRDIERISSKLVTGDYEAGIQAEPFYGHFFIGLVKKITYRTSTLAVAYDQNLITLYVNPGFWHEYLQHDALKLGAIKHEILHLVFKHILRVEGFNNKKVFNIAADLVVNQYVDEKQLLDGAVTLYDFESLELKPHQHVNYYYTHLLDLLNKYTDNPESDEAQQDRPWNTLRSFLDDENPLHSKHWFWQDIEKITGAEKDIAESIIDQAMESTLSWIKTEDYEKLPKGLKQYLGKFEQARKPMINWKRALRLFANSSRNTKIRNTIRRPSKRYGTNPGIRVKRNQKILVAIDTSGSIQLDELNAFFSEVFHIWQQGVEITIVESDTKIQAQYPYRGVAPKLVQGRGGTSFEAPIRFANTQYRPDALIYFTDGYGPSPEIRSLCPIFWLISKKGAKPDYLQNFPGRVVRMS